jgi:hypothetical protein
MKPLLTPLKLFLAIYAAASLFPIFALAQPFHPITLTEPFGLTNDTRNLAVQIMEAIRSDPANAGLSEYQLADKAFQAVQNYRSPQYPPGPQPAPAPFAFLNNYGYTSPIVANVDHFLLGYSSALGNTLKDNPITATILAAVLDPGYNALKGLSQLSGAPYLIPISIAPESPANFDFWTLAGAYTARLVDSYNLPPLGYDGNVIANGHITDGKVTDKNGNIEEGHFKDGHFTDGKATFKDGNIAEGHFQDGRLNGAGKFTFKDGNIKEGSFKDGRFTDGKFTFKDGNIAEGHFQDGRLTGAGKVTFKDGDIQEGHFTDGKATFKDGNIKEGHFQDRRLNGTGKRSFKNGDIEEGNFKDDHLTDGKVTFGDGDIEEGHFQDGRLNGAGKFTSKDGKIKEGSFKDGHFTDGKVYVDGNIVEGHFQDGLLTGAGKVSLKSGEIAEGEFKDGQLSAGKVLSPNGDSLEGEFKDGKLISGKARITGKDGSVYVGSFMNGGTEGHGTFTRPDGSTHAGDIGVSGRADGAHEFRGTEFDKEKDGTISVHDLDEKD